MDDDSCKLDFIDTVQPDNYADYCESSDVRLSLYCIKVSGTGITM